MICMDDGFMVKSENKEEVINLAAMHFMTMHPKEKINRSYVAKMVKTLKEKDMKIIKERETW